ncbi:MAG: S9 family peptidase [Bacteroidetes bacterium]|nr:MAG: S9 family peptidase [Bacteroidota bacterium]
MKKVIFLSLLLLFSISFLKAETDTSNQKISINQWLIAGSASVKMPAFSQRNSVKGKKFKAVDLLKFQSKKIIAPLEGDTFLINTNHIYQWKAARLSKSDYVNIKPVKGAVYNKAWLATYLTVNRFIKIDFKTETRQCFELYVDGVKKVSKYTVTDEKKKADTKIASLNLEKGTHLISIKTLYNADKKGVWKLIASMYFNRNIPKETVTVTTHPSHFMDIDHLMNGKHLQDASVSFNGKLIMLRYSKVYPPNGKTESWFEIRDREHNKLIYSSEFAKVNNVQWVPGKEAVSFKAKAGGIDKLFLLNLKTMNKTVLLYNLKNTGYYQWSPTGNFMVYSINEKPVKNKSGLIHVVNMMDRWPWWRSRGQLYKLNISDLTTERLTYGYLSSELQDIRHDGKKILISQSIPNFLERPYTRQIMIELDLSSLKADTIWNQDFGGRAQYSPDDKQLLVTGSSAMFNGAGVSVPMNVIPNDYDTQAYIYDLKNGDVSGITKDFDPSIQDAEWNITDNNIYFRVEEKSWSNLYQYNPKENKWLNLHNKTDMVSGFKLAINAPVIVYYGSSIQYPKTAWSCNLDGSNQKLLDDPEKDFFKNITFGNTENWSFKNVTGRTIEGRVYYPPDYDQNKKYPVIVYYYGGTSPTGRTFRGRYPKNLFAAQGYIVYVLQPSGATGFGQEFSALHVNNWGETVADEIILGTKTFLKEHPSANAKKVGCMGASYGGFMTMLLTTRTNIFATAIAHAGISSISSYWGEGYWGYLYSSVASANSFPWNNNKLYVGQSPLFHADKVTTPLLLLHGNADTNVPIGESLQMYTALKLLGKTVELVEIEGQDHHIVDYKKRILWQKTILAWFDRWLKDQPEWWNKIYPKEDL